MEDDGIDVFSGLNSIGSLSSSDLGDNRVSISGRKFRRVASRAEILIRDKIMEYPSDSKLTNT